MAEFQREERYLVVKLDRLTEDQGDGMSRAESIYRTAHFGKALVECVVVEADWPIYDETWENIQRLAEGKPSIGQERDALAAHVERLRAPAIKLATAVENRDELPLHKWAVKCAYLVSQVHQTANVTPEASFAKLKAEWQAEALRDFASKIEVLDGLTSGDRMADEARRMAKRIESGS